MLGAALACFAELPFGWYANCTEAPGNLSRADRLSHNGLRVMSRRGSRDDIQASRNHFLEKGNAPFEDTRGRGAFANGRIPGARSAGETLRKQRVRNPPNLTAECSTVELPGDIGGHKKRDKWGCRKAVNRRQRNELCDWNFSVNSRTLYRREFAVLAKCPRFIFGLSALRYGECLPVAFDRAGRRIWS